MEIPSKESYLLKNYSWHFSVNSTIIVEAYQLTEVITIFFFEMGNEDCDHSEDASLQSSSIIH